MLRECPDDAPPLLDEELAGRLSPALRQIHVHSEPLLLDGGAHEIHDDKLRVPGLERLCIQSILEHPRIPLELHEINETPHPLQPDMLIPIRQPLERLQLRLHAFLLHPQPQEAEELEYRFGVHDGVQPTEIRLKCWRLLDSTEVRLECWRLQDSGEQKRRGQHQPSFLKKVEQVFQKDAPMHVGSVKVVILLDVIIVVQNDAILDPLAPADLHLVHQFPHQGRHLLNVWRIVHASGTCVHFDEVALAQVHDAEFVPLLLCELPDHELFGSARQVPRQLLVGQG
eukprot:4550637-Prymnesium_polylepis.1